MRKGIIVIGLCLLSMVSFASNYSFLNYSAITYFTGKDEQVMVQTVDKALNSVPDGRKISWSNPQSGSWGFVVPSHTTIANGLKCRNLKIFNSAKQVTGESNYRLCKFNDGWKIISN